MICACPRDRKTDASEEHKVRPTEYPVDYRTLGTWERMDKRYVEKGVSNATLYKWSVENAMEGNANQGVDA